MARSNVSSSSLAAYIKESCDNRSYGRCRAIQKGGVCYIRPCGVRGVCSNDKTRMMKHASYLLNWEYKESYVCSSALGQIIYDNPCKTFLPPFLYTLLKIRKR